MLWLIGPRGMRGLPGVEGYLSGGEGCHSAAVTCVLALWDSAPQQNCVGRWQGISDKSVNYEGCTNL